MGAGTKRHSGLAVASHRDDPVGREHLGGLVSFSTLMVWKFQLTRVAISKKRVGELIA